MLAVVGSAASRLHANSVGYCLAQSWAAAGRPVVLVDADTTGSALFERLSEATSRRYDPQQRGLPSLMAARSGVTAEALAAHSYRAPGDEGSLWMLLGPRHVEGGALAARWLADRFGDLCRVDSERAMVLAASLLLADGRLRALLSLVPAVAVIAPVRSVDDLCGLRHELHEAGLDPCDGHRSLSVVVEGDSHLGDAEIAEVLGVQVAGRLREAADARVLCSPQRRRSRLARDIRALAVRLEPHLGAVFAGDRDTQARAPVFGDHAADPAAAADDRSAGSVGASTGALRLRRRRSSQQEGSVPSTGAPDASVAGRPR